MPSVPPSPGCAVSRYNKEKVAQTASPSQQAGTIIFPTLHLPLHFAFPNLHILLRFNLLPARSDTLPCSRRIGLRHYVAVVMRAGSGVPVPLHFAANIALAHQFVAGHLCGKLAMMAGEQRQAAR